MQGQRKNPAKPIISEPRQMLKVPPSAMPHYDMIQYFNKPAISIVVKFRDMFGRNVRLEMPRHKFSDFKSWYVALLDAGYPFSKDINECRKLHEDLGNSRPRHRLRIVEKPGLYHKPLRYLLPGQSVTFNGIDYLFPATENSQQSATNGTLNGWQKMAGLGSHSPAMVLGFCHAFAALLLPAVGYDNGGFYMSTSSESDRLTFIQAVASVYGVPGDIRLGNKSAVELKAVTTGHNHSLLCPQYAVDSIPAKQLANVVASLNSNEARLNYILTGNSPLPDLIRGARLNGDLNAIKRLNTIPLSWHEFGLYQSLPESCTDGSQLSKTIRYLASQHYGWAIREFSEQLIAEIKTVGPKAIGEEIRREMRIFASELNMSGPEEYEFVRPFAFAAASGVIVSRLKVLPLDPKAIRSAIAQCYRIARPSEIGALIAEAERLQEEDIDRVRRWISEPPDEKLLALRMANNKPSWTANQALNADAFFDERLNAYLFPSETLMRLLDGSRKKLSQLVKWLNEDGLLIRKDRRVFTCQYRIFGIRIPSRPRYYLIRGEFFNPPKTNGNGNTLVPPPGFKSESLLDQLISITKRKEQSKIATRPTNFTESAHLSETSEESYTSLSAPQRES